MAVAVAVVVKVVLVVVVEVIEVVVLETVIVMVEEVSSASSSGSRSGSRSRGSICSGSGTSSGISIIVVLSWRPLFGAGSGAASHVQLCVVQVTPLALSVMLALPEALRSYNTDQVLQRDMLQSTAVLQVS